MFLEGFRRAFRGLLEGLKSLKITKKHPKVRVENRQFWQIMMWNMLKIKDIGLILPIYGERMGSEGFTEQINRRSRA
jgi:hypothetical protein